jgi:hypothetical protein
MKTETVHASKMSLSIYKTTLYYITDAHNLITPMKTLKHLLLGVFNSAMLGGFTVTMAWRVLRLRMDERPPAMEGSCEYIEQAATGKRQGVAL